MKDKRYQLTCNNDKKRKQISEEKNVFFIVFPLYLMTLASLDDTLDQVGYRQPHTIKHNLDHLSDIKGKQETLLSNLF